MKGGIEVSRDETECSVLIADAENRRQLDV